MIVKEPNKDYEKKYREHIQSNEKSRIYHTLKWEQITEDIKHKPYYLLAIDENEEIAGVLLLFFVDNFSGKKIISVPLRDRCGPIYNNLEALQLLLKKGKELCREKKCFFIEIKMTEQLPEEVIKKLGFVKSEFLIRTRTNLEKPIEEL